MSIEKAEQKIKKAKERNRTRLNLSHLDLTIVPESIVELTNLSELDLSSNQLTEIPDSITKLTNLTRLYLSSNQLMKIPDNIGQLSELFVLDLSSNQLTEVPSSISQLSKLFVLDLNSNQLTEVPDSISQLSNLSEFYLSSNQLTEPPESISQLNKLSILDLSSNQLMEIPDSISQLSNLTDLDLRSNKLTEIPDSINQLSNLTDLDLRSNQLIHLPSFLFEFGQIEDFDITTKTGEILYSVGLYLHGNPIQTPPLEIISQGKEEILKYFKSLEEQGEEKLFEAKLIIVGSGGVGKTTLAKKLIDQTYKVPTEENTTHGIDVREYHFPLQYKGEQEDFQANIWDFGGQELYHSTHQFFLTRRSLYVLVSDNRKEDADFHYWLHTISLLAEDSPVLILQNEKEGRTKELNYKDIKRAFPNLIDNYYNVNFENNDGLAGLKEALEKQFKNLPQVGEPIPAKWKALRELIEEDGRDYINYDTFLGFAEQIEVEEEELQRISQYLHDLGIILHFQDDMDLQNLIILNPEWGTDAVYKVLDAPRIVQQKGRFSQQDLSEIWKAAKYSRAKHSELLHLMMKFELCYQVVGKKVYIAPQLLPVEEPEYSFPEEDLLRLDFSYAFMPKGMLTRFIVRVHALTKDDLAWRTGVVIHKNGTQAEIIEYLQEKRISIKVSGKENKELLYYIIQNFNAIHTTFKRLVYEELIPCNCQQCFDADAPEYFSMKTIEKAQAKRKSTIECRESFDDVSIQHLLAAGRPEYVNISSLKNKIADDKIGDVFRELLDKSKGLPYHNEVVLLSGRYKKKCEEERIGGVNKTILNTEHRSIASALLNLLNAVEDGSYGK